MFIIKDINDNNLNEVCRNTKPPLPFLKINHAKAAGIVYNIAMENMGGRGIFSKFC